MQAQPSAGKASSQDAPATMKVEISIASMIWMVLVLVGVWTLVKLVPVILVLVTALFLVGTFSPVVEALEQKGLKRFGAIAVVFTLLFVSILLLSFLTVPAFMAQVKSLVAHEPALRNHLADMLAGVPLASALSDTLRNVRYDSLISSSAATVVAVSTRVLQFVAYAAGAIFLALYIMIDRDRLRGAMFAVVPRAHHIRLSRIILNLQTIVGGYIRGQLITTFMMTVFLFFVLKFAGVPNALALAVFGGLADMLPFIGAFLTMGPAVAAAFTVSPMTAFVVFVILLSYEEFESRIIIPLVYGRALRLPSSVILFALITGGTLMGIVGALLALPVAAAALMLIDELQVDLPGEAEMEEDRHIRRSEREYERRTEGVPAEEAAALALKIANIQKRREAEQEKRDQEKREQESAPDTRNDKEDKA
ncbi:AI-2E family transporter [Noviherbaspirillum galbum]|uniref:AI-2E family transporter n=1 Tax=Noviherbaspirillum galbum TaxID=2709383 RepID=A0A6B3SYW9_9BURK|nr:AI-2E family transporter [Noviherbaspirillum galbum]NEX64102.1 AI-2E family transporter [Noviherbaspirillum galbum]